jgi:hypothetical protein
MKEHHSNGAMTLIATTFGTTTLSIMDLFCDSQHNSIECHYAECRYVECCYSECHGNLEVSCSILVSDICFLRLDFETFTLISPSETANSYSCPDTFKVTVSF